MTLMSDSPRARWTRQQMLVALILYCRLPFGKLDHRNPDVVKYAKLIGRTPSALAMKLGNIASLDPAITSTGRAGLANASSTDGAMWDEMQADWEAFAVNADAAMVGFGVAADAIDEVTVESDVDYTGIDRPAQVAVRIGQAFFRRAVLSAYDYKCCITGLNVGSLLVASHIVPWRADPSNRLNPRNGLCLSALHDRSFDAGIITVAEDMTVRVSKEFSAGRDEFFESAITRYNGRPISLPEKFQPDHKFLQYHREHIYRS